MSVLAGQPQASIEPMMLYMGRLAREAARELAFASTAQKNAALEAMARRIIGRKSGELPEILGYRGDPELIHRDDMVLHRKG